MKQTGIKGRKSMDKETLREEIRRFVSRYGREHFTETSWGTPLTGFADAHDPLFKDLRKAVSGTHALPHDLLPSASTVVAFFIPPGRDVIRSNRGGRLASRQWAQAYIDTNSLIFHLGLHLSALLEAAGHATAVTPATHDFEADKLTSDWSHRHVAYIAGLGGFGVNNMLITASGCCGRLGSLVTDLKLAPDERSGRESCLFRNGSKCLRCVDKCVGQALFPDRFDRWKCHAVCRENEELFRDLGRADVCGKCLAGLPCSWTDPVLAVHARGGC